MDDQLFSQLTDSIREAGRIQRGEAPPARSFTFAPLDVRRLRARLGKSQTEFAQLIGVSPHTLRNWEQGRRQPEGPALALLTVTAASPQTVMRALARRRAVVAVP